MKISLSVVENLSADICKKYFTKNDPLILNTIQKFWDVVLQPKMQMENNPEVGGEKWNEIVESELSKEANAEFLPAVQTFSAKFEEIISKKPKAEILGAKITKLNQEQKERS